MARITSYQGLANTAMELSETMKAYTGKSSKKSPQGGKVHKVMHEFKHGTLHSGSKHGPKVKSRKQAVAIALSEQRKQNRGGY